MIENVLTGEAVLFQLARFCVVMAIGVVFTRTVLMPAIRVLMSRKGSDLKAKHSMENIAGIIGLFTSFIVALQAGNFGNLVSVLGTVAAALTVAVGFGMRDQVSSMVSGIFIHTDNPFVKGDYLKAENFEGVVKEIKLRYTALNGKDGEVQMIPNNLITNNPVKNMTRGNRTKSVLELKIPAEKLEKAARILQDSATENDSIMDKPEPQVSFEAVEEDKVLTKLSYWLKGSEKLKKVRTELLETFTFRAKKEDIFEKKE